MNGVLSPLSEGGAAAVVCSAGAERDALAEPLAEVGRTPVDSGVSPWGIDMLPETDASDPTGGNDSTGRVMVTSSLMGTGRDTGGTLVSIGTGMETGGTLVSMGTGMEAGGTLLGTGRDSTGKLIIGSVAEPVIVSQTALDMIEYL